jgi:GT2 family glycosyltransferase
MSNVLITIPSYNNKGSILKLLDSLKEQTYKKFEIAIFLKCSQTEFDKDLLDKIACYNSLSISIIKQQSGYFDEAMNLIFNYTDSGIVLNTDDDATVSKTWVSDHLKIHSKYPKIGMASGIVIENILKSPIMNFLYNQKWRINKHTFIDKPISKIFSNFGMYVGKSGMLVDTGPKYNIKTLKLRGVNMSWKAETLQGFKLLRYTLRGTHNEAAAGIEVLRRGYIPINFNNGAVYHPLHNSLSRTDSPLSFPSLLSIESVLFAYNTSKFFKIDLNILKKRTFVDDIITRIITKNKNTGYSTGFSIVKYSLEKSLSPKSVRELIKKVSY